jgi:hypothetical protein
MNNSNSNSNIDKVNAAIKAGNKNMSALKEALPDMSADDITEAVKAIKAAKNKSPEPSKPVEAPEATKAEVPAVDRAFPDSLPSLATQNKATTQGKPTVSQEEIKKAVAKQTQAALQSKQEEPVAGIKKKTNTTQPQQPTIPLTQPSTNITTKKSVFLREEVGQPEIPLEIIDETSTVIIVQRVKPRKKVTLPNGQTLTLTLEEIEALKSQL